MGGEKHQTRKSLQYQPNSKRRGGGGTADISAQKQIDKLTKKAAPKDGDIFAERNQTVI